MDMPRVFRSSTVRFATLVAGALVAAAPAVAALDMPNLSGKWYLNKDASDSPDAMRSSEGSGSGSGYHGGGGGGGTGMGRGGHGGGGGRHGGRSAPSDDGAVSEDGSPMNDAYAFQRTQILDIRHEEPKLSVTDAAGRERIFYTDGRKVEEEHSYGGTTKVTARWKDGHVEITSAPEKGPEVTETYAVTADHSQLTVTTTFQGGRRDVTIRRVYQTTPPEQAAPQGPPPSTPSQPAPESDPAEDAVV